MCLFGVLLGEPQIRDEDEAVVLLSGGCRESISFNGGVISN